MSAVDHPRITLDAGGRRAQLAVVWTTLAVAAAAFAVGMPALVWAGQAAGLGAAAWLVPLVVDGGLTVAGLAAAVRHSQRRRAGLETAMLAGLTVLSMAAQAWHAWQEAAPIVAALVAAAAPLTVLASTHAAFRAVLSEPATRGRKRATVPAAKPAVAPAPAVKTPTSPVASKATPATGALAEVLGDVLAGRLSQRQAATLAGVSRHAVAAAVQAATAG